MTGPTAPDAAERERALDPRRSFIVRAPAGSGKTELLIRRYLALLATVEDAEEIVAITFTRKAAAEMRQRVLKRLGEAGDPLAGNPARLRIQTIDSLCASLTRQMPILSRFGAQPESIDDARELYEEAALATIALVEEPGAGEVAKRIERLLDHLDNDVGRVQGLLADMLARRDHWVRHLARMDRADLEAALAAERERVTAQARALYPGADPGDAGAWQSLAQSLLTKEGEWRKRSKEAKAYAEEGDAREPLRAILQTLLVLPPATYTDEQAEVLEAIGGVLPHAIAQLKLVFQARGQVDFTEVSQGALLALGPEGEPTDLALALDYRIRHLLIDEFQDTSISQYELVARLTEGWEPGDGRTLLAVGDPMQSIYRFRDAEVGLFLQARREGIGTVELEPVELRANFRSQAGIVGWVNATFARVMPEREDAATGAVAYGASVAVHPALEGDAVSVHPFFDKDYAGEAARVVDLVRGAQAGDPGASVAILVRTRSHLADIVPQLKAAGLAFRAIEIEGLAHRPVVQDLLALTRALSHPADRLAWLSVLRAPWCGLSLADLARLAGGDDAGIFELLRDQSRLAGLSADGRARLERAAAVLQDCMSNRMRASLRDSVEGAWLALGGPACVEDATDLEDADIFLDHLEAHEQAGAVDAAFEAGLEKLYALPDLRADERLQVMTMHKAKGLEFDHVILPGLGRVPRGDDKKLFLWIETAARERAGLLLAPIQESGADTDPIYAWLQRLDAAKAGLEAARLVYVAATRARRRLHLLGDVRVKDGAIRPPAPATLLGKLWPVVADAFEAALQLHRPAHAPVGPPALPDQALVRLAPGWRMPEAPAPVAWVAPADEARVQDEIEFSWAGEAARHVGSVVHRWLQRIAEDGLRGWDALRVESLGAQFANELAACGVAPREIGAARDKVAAALAGAVRDERGRWLLGPRDQAASELRLRTSRDGRLRTLVIDRTFVEDGRRWIVDYKTSGHEGAGLEAFLERERERYAPQLARYAEALGGARLGLYFPMLRGWREWEG
ncbi:MAG: UvrD-helicase domain-containing protein [Proteobacteria bacterium]|nr:UvrD-helicase domain-containing protein [Pseudomonadota bacterium]